MKRKLLTSMLLAAVLAVAPLTASATNVYRSAEVHQRERVPIQNTATHESTSYKQFSDVADSYWGKDGISYVVDMGLFNGTGNGMFSPEMTMNRAMICTVLHRFAGSPAVNGSSGYSDVKSGQWYTDGVTWVKQNKILPLDLLNSSKLEPERSLTRDDFAVMMRNYYEVSTGDICNDAMGAPGLMFPDLPTDSYEVIWAMAWLYTYSVLNGTSGNTMSPEMALTRSQMAAILERYDRQFGAGDFSRSNSGTTTTPTSQTTDEKEEDKLIQLINDYRAENGLPRLSKNEKLMEAADIRAKEAAFSFSHTRPNGTFAATALEDVGVPNDGYFWENLYSGAGADSSFNAWKYSTGHNRTMLTSDPVTNIGVGIYSDGHGNCATALIITS